MAPEVIGLLNSAFTGDLLAAGSLAQSCRRHGTPPGCCKVVLPAGRPASAAHGVFFNCLSLGFLPGWDVANQENEV